MSRVGVGVGVCRIRMGGGWRYGWVLVGSDEFWRIDVGMCRSER